MLWTNDLQTALEWLGGFVLGWPRAAASYEALRRVRAGASPRSLVEARLKGACAVADTGEGLAEIGEAVGHLSF